MKPLFVLTADARLAAADLPTSARGDLAGSDVLRMRPRSARSSKLSSAELGSHLGRLIPRGESLPQTRIVGLRLRCALPIREVVGKARGGLRAHRVTAGLPSGASLGSGIPGGEPLPVLDADGVALRRRLPTAQPWLARLASLGHGLRRPGMPIDLPDARSLREGLFCLAPGLMDLLHVPAAQLALSLRSVPTARVGTLDADPVAVAVVAAGVGESNIGRDVLAPIPTGDRPAIRRGDPRSAASSRRHEMASPLGAQTFRHRAFKRGNEALAGRGNQYRRGLEDHEIGGNHHGPFYTVQPYIYGIVTFAAAWAPMS